MRRPLLVVLAAASLATGCVPLTMPESDVDAIASADTASATIETYLKHIPCSTEPVRGLSQQLIDELLCDSPTALEAITPQDKLSFSDDSVLPYLSPKAAASLRTLAVAGTIVVSSATRTLAQQFLLAAWKAAGRCGIPAAADPGTSQHEAGLAIDVRVSSALTKRLLAAGWARETGEDPIHFVYATPASDLSQSIAAFQRLWNHNRPYEPVPETGVLDSLTVARLRETPAQGFPGGTSCTPIDVAMNDAPNAGADPAAELPTFQ